MVLEQQGCEQVKRRRAGWEGKRCPKREREACLSDARGQEMKWLGTGWAGRELGHRPQIPRQVPDDMAAYVSGRSWLTKPCRVPRMLPPARGAP